MKKQITIYFIALLIASLFVPQQIKAQSPPQKMSYQAVIRDANNVLITSTTVGMQISILQASAMGGSAPVYVETQTPSTNINGLVSLEVGTGTVVLGTFSTIDWANGPFYIKIETDPTGGTTYSITGTSQLLSVPYALYAGTSGSTANSWNLTGNASTVDGTNFIGTTDNIPLTFKVNNQKAGRIDHLLFNTFFGYQAGNANTIGSNNTVNGDGALFSNTTGRYNTANGVNALYANTTGNYNTANGFQALFNNTTGSSNTANGYRALYWNTTGIQNTTLGYQADVSTGALTNATAIGSGAIVNASNTIQLGNSSVTAVKTNGAITAGAVTYLNTDGTSGQVLTTNGAGVTSWTTVGLSPGTSPGQMQYWNGTNWVVIAPGTNGQALTNCYGTPTWGACTPPVIGDNFQGGIIFYILQTGDPGYVTGETHGLIAATADQSNGIQWYNGSNTTTGAISTALGTGSANTTTIISIQGAGSYAATICDNYAGGGYTDWYLPSKDELNKLYLNSGAVGGFASVSVSYWSSTEDSNSNAWLQIFGITGLQGSYYKSLTVSVRAIRAF